MGVFWGWVGLFLVGERGPRHSSAGIAVLESPSAASAFPRRSAEIQKTLIWDLSLDLDSLKRYACAARVSVDGVVTAELPSGSAGVNSCGMLTKITSRVFFFFFNLIYSRMHEEITVMMGFLVNLNTSD